MIEIMIAISIFAMVMIAIYSSWSSVMRGARTGMAAAAEVQRTRVATRALEEALASAIMYVDNAKYYHFSTDTSGDNAYITFVARLPSTFPGSGLFGDQDVRRVCFYVENGNLMLSQGPIMEATKKIGKPYTIALAPGVTLFDMEFYDGMAHKWFAEWISTNQLPKMARLAISFSPNPGLRKPESMTLRTIPLGGFAITRAGAGVTGGSGNGLAQGMLNNRRNIAPTAGGFAPGGAGGSGGFGPGNMAGGGGARGMSGGFGGRTAGGPTDDDLWSAYLPPNFRAGGKFGSKERSSLFPPE